MPEHARRARTGRRPVGPARAPESQREVVVGTVSAVRARNAARIFARVRARVPARVAALTPETTAVAQWSQASARRYVARSSRVPPKWSAIATVDSRWRSGAGRHLPAPGSESSQTRAGREPGRLECLREAAEVVAGGVPGRHGHLAARSLTGRATAPYPGTARRNAAARRLPGSTRGERRGVAPRSSGAALWGASAGRVPHQRGSRARRSGRPPPRRHHGCAATARTQAAAVGVRRLPKQADTPGSAGPTGDGLATADGLSRQNN
jgi:hypothetical protein